MAHIKNFNNENPGLKIRHCMLLPSPGISLNYSSFIGDNDKDFKTSFTGFSVTLLIYLLICRNKRELH